MSADPWQQTGMPADRSYPPDRASRPVRGDHDVRASRPVPPLPSRRRPAEGARPTEMRSSERRGSYDDSGAFARPSAPRSAGGAGRASRRTGDPSVDQQRSATSRGGADRSPRGADRYPRGATAATPSRGGRLRGSIAALAVFLLTLAGAGVDSFVGVGLGTITLLALAVSAAGATLLVRRRDLLSVVAAPPLVFVAVAAIDVALAPSGTFSLPTIATLLIRGFPTMAIATGLALVLALIRLAARR